MKARDVSTVIGRERLELDRFYFTWACPRCKVKCMENSHGLVKADIADDPLCCYCRARSDPADSRNKVEQVGATFQRRKEAPLIAE